MVEVVLHHLVRAGALDDQLAEVFVEQVADDPDDQVGLLVELHRRATGGDLRLDALPLRRQPRDVAFELVFGGSLGGRTHDHAGALGDQPLEDVAETLALDVGELAADAGRVAVRHVDEVPAGQRDVARQPSALVADRVLGDLHEHRVAGLQRVLDRAGPALEPGHVPVDLAGVKHGVAAAADVDERGFHARQDVLHLAEVDVADEGTAGRPGHVVLDEHAVFEHSDLRAVALLPDRHDPVDGFAAGQELRLAEDRRTRAALVTAIAAALTLRFEPGRAADALHLVASGPRLTDLDDGDDAVLGLDVIARTGTTAAPAPATTGQAVTRLGIVIVGTLFGRLDGLRVVAVFIVERTLATATATTTTAAAAPGRSRLARVVLVIVFVVGLVCRLDVECHVDRLGGHGLGIGAVTAATTVAAAGAGRRRALVIAVLVAGRDRRTARSSRVSGRAPQRRRGRPRRRPALRRSPRSVRAGAGRNRTHRQQAPRVAREFRWAQRRRTRRPPSSRHGYAYAGWARPISSATGSLGRRLLGRLLLRDSGFDDRRRLVGREVSGVCRGLGGATRRARGLASASSSAVPMAAFVAFALVAFFGGAVSSAPVSASPDSADAVDAAAGALDNHGSRVLPSPVRNSGLSGLTTCGNVR